MAIPEFLEETTQEQLIQQMLDALPDDFDKTEGGFNYDVVAACATILTQSAEWAKHILEIVFAQTSYGEHLEMRVGEHGIERLPATHATGQITVTAQPGTLPVFRAATPADPITGAPSVEFETEEEVLVDVSGVASVPIRAVEAGAGGNVIAGAINVLATSLPGVASITNEEPTAGGADEESDEALLERYLLMVRTPSAGGNIADYVNWAREVPGVGGAAVVPVEGGSGTVTIALIGTDKLPASQAVVDAVQDYIAPDGALGGGKAPIGASVSVEAATTLDVDVSATLVIANGYNASTVRSAAEAKIAAYLELIVFAADNDVKYSRIANAILDTDGVLDYSDLSVNGGTANIAVGAKVVAVPGAVNLS